MLLVTDVKATTNVSGLISSDTTWTQANSPYLLTGTLTVNSGVTLTIQPGVTVDLASYSFLVGGTLNATGTSDNNINFQTSYSYSSIRIQFLSTSANWTATTNSGCIVTNSLFNSVGIIVTNCSPKISNNYFTNNRFTPISVNGGSVLILSNAFDCQATAITISGVSASPIISSNFIKSNSYGIYSTGNNAYISDNNITRCSTGVFVTGNSTITRNLITNNTNGIYSLTNLPWIANNIVANNGIGVMGGGTIQNNTIGNNTIGVGVSFTPSNISQNNFFNNTQFNLGLSMLNSTDAINNWWGTADISAINQAIYDSKNYTSLGTVNFTPFLAEPNLNAPSLESVNYVPAPTPTPYPSLIPAPTVTPYPTIHSTPPPYLNITTPTPTLSPTDTPTPIPTPSPQPTSSPIPKKMPGTPLNLADASFIEGISQFDITNIAKLVLIALGIMWLVIILIYIDRDFAKKDHKKSKK